MPFTLAHPAAVLPLARRPLVPAALVAGALSPDVPYFVPVPRSAGAWYEPFVNATTTHAWPGALTVAVPTAAVLLGLWWVVRVPLRALVALPDAAAAERDAASPGLVRASWVLASLSLGVLTHVAWDAFTHGDGLVVQHVPWLRDPLVGDVTAARVLQHASTVLGLLVLAAWAARATTRWWRAGGRLPLDRARVAVAVALAAAGAAGAVVGAAGAAGSGIEAVLSAAAKTGGVAFVSAILVGAALWWLARWPALVTPRTRGR